MSIPTTREQGDLARINDLVDHWGWAGCAPRQIADAWGRIKADIATRELAIAERDVALARAEAMVAENARLRAEFTARTIEAGHLKLALARAEAGAIELGSPAPPPDRGALAARIVDGLYWLEYARDENTSDQVWVRDRYHELTMQGVDFTGAARRARVEFAARVLAEAGIGGTEGGDA